MVSLHTKIFSKLALILALIAATPISLVAQEDPFDPFDLPDFSEDSRQEPQDDQNKSVLQLILEASQLFSEERLLDGRTKLLVALKKDPKQYRIHMMLSGYYMQHVGHFRLALRYARQAEKLLIEKRGSPPYSEPFVQGDHQQILYLIAQGRLNLDDYQGALQTLDYFASLGYNDEWYPGTRSWVLMKLGRLDDAIAEAKKALNDGLNDGRTLNMLGILLSMKGERSESLKIFREAITYELSLGREGQPATPLNNQGEVYKELFLDDRAESSWRRATSMPDGCEHVLPSLNTAMLFLDQLRGDEAAKMMDTFEACVAQFPLRNGEEHKALVHLIRGRVALLNGFPQEAIKHLELAIASRQWFGKIGTDQEDLEAGALLSLSTAIDAQINYYSSSPSLTFSQRVSIFPEIISQRVKSWWFKRRARQLLVEQLGDFEDFTIRHTDSLLEYPYLGTYLTDLPLSVLKKKLEQEKESDKRNETVPFYKSYLAHNLAYHGDRKQSIELAEEVVQDLRSEYDKALLLDGYLLLSNLSKSSPDSYANYIYKAFELNHASVRNAGLKLPVKISSKDSSLEDAIDNSPFIRSESTKARGSLSIVRQGDTVTAQFRISEERSISSGEGKSSEEALSALIESIFSKEDNKKKEARK